MEAAVKTCDCAQKIAALEAQVSDLTSLVSVVSRMELLIKHYENQLMMLKRRQFGTSSERVEVDGQLQLSLFGAAESQPINASLEPEVEEISYKRKKRIGKRDEDLSDLLASPFAMLNASTTSCRLTSAAAQSAVNP